MQFPHIPEAVRIQRLEAPTGKVRMVLDTDTYNEIDDQFTVVYSLLSPEKLDVEAIYAAPFCNERSQNNPALGMEQSYEEILRLLEKLGRSPEGFVFKGSTRFLPDEATPPQHPRHTILRPQPRRPSPKPPQQRRPRLRTQTLQSKRTRDSSSGGTQKPQAIGRHTDHGEERVSFNRQ
jgi:hypothetical protein